MGSLLSKPLTSKNIVSLRTPYLHCGSAEMHGCRIAMEDAHILREASKNPNDLIVGIFDGHNGAECSSFVAKAIEETMMEEPAFPLAHDRIQEIVMSADSAYFKAGGEAGSTGVFALLHHNAVDESRSAYKAQIINVGDSRAILWKSKTKSCVSVTVDHKPNTLTERQRIEAAGGHVSVGRVNGDLALSRAFGDFQFKGNHDLPMELQAVCTVPDIFMHDFDEGDILIVACDGVFEANFTNEEVAAFASENLLESEDPSLTACRVIDEALHRGSKDNISCTIVWNKPATDDLLKSPQKSSFSIPGSYLPLFGNGNPGYRDGFERMCTRGGVEPAHMIERRFNMLKAALGRGEPEPSWEKTWEVVKDTCSPEEGFEELDAMENLIEKCSSHDQKTFFSTFWTKRGML